MSVKVGFVTVNLRPRSKLRIGFLIPAVIMCALVTLPVCAQRQRRTRTRPPAVSTAQESSRLRRAQAVTLLVETADKARTFDDLFYRARIQALVADALWPADSVQARAIFRRAWEAAAASDKADQEEAAREAGVLPGAVPKLTEARDEVLKIAARRDQRLGEIFLRDLSSEKDKENAARNEASRPTAWRELSASGARRLALAYEMLAANEPRRAAEVAAPLVNEGVKANLIAFILRLRDRSITEADKLYLRLLERAAADPLTDANAVLLLSSPVVSPELMVVVDEFGSLQIRALPPAIANAATMQTVTRKAWTAFYNLAASVLLRPLPPRDSLTMQELMARFYATGRLLPWFESSSAQHAAYAPALRARHSELFNEIEAGRREQVSSQFTLSSLTPTGYVDPLRTQSQQLVDATDAVERASLALSIVKTAVRNRYWDRARRAAAEIEDEPRRKVALSFIQVHQIKDILRAYEDQKEDDSESIAKFVREADVPPFAKAWGLAQAATIAARKNDSRALQNASEIINEAESQASRVAVGTPERVAAYGVTTTAAARFDAQRAWGLLREFVKAANSVEDFTGDEVSFDLASGEDLTAETAENFSVEAEVFRLDQIFATMAHLDFDKALAEARALDREVPQAFATIAVARTMLENRR